MRKKVFTLALVALLSMHIPCVASFDSENGARTALPQTSEQVQINVRNGVLHVSSINEKTIEIYKLTGERVAQFRIEGQERRIELGLRGIYIVKIGKLVRKVVLS